MNHTEDRGHQKGWKGLFLRVGYPGILLASVGVAWLLMASGYALTTSAWVSILLVGVVMAALEFLFPFRSDWKPTRKVLFLDLAHNFVSSVLLAPLVKAGMAALVVLFYSVLPTKGGIWPQHWPIALQLLLMVPLADFGVYWAHRWMHATDTGWRVHAVHHTPRGLNFWAAARTHPFNVFVALGAELTVLMFLGVGQAAFTLWLVYKSVNGLLQHANIDLHPGVLSFVLATNEAHRIHHSADMEHSHSNFGNTTMIWDRVFGTFSTPSVGVAEVGIAGSKIPDDYWAQLTVPFVDEHFGNPIPLSIEEGAREQKLKVTHSK